MPLFGEPKTLCTPLRNYQIFFLCFIAFVGYLLKSTAKIPTFRFYKVYKSVCNFIYSNFICNLNATAYFYFFTHLLTCLF